MIMTAFLDFIFMKVYACALNRRNGWGIYILQFLPFLVHCGIQERMKTALIWEAICILSTWLGEGAQDTMVAVRATGHILGIF